MTEASCRPAELGAPSPLPPAAGAWGPAGCATKVFGPSPAGLLAKITWIVIKFYISWHLCDPGVSSLFTDNSKEKKLNIFMAKCKEYEFLFRSLIISCSHIFSYFSNSKVKRLCLISIDVKYYNGQSTSHTEA